MKTIGIVGYGYVGKAIEYGFKGICNIRIHDIAIPSEPLAQVVAAADIIFISVPTPTNFTKPAIDLSVIKSVLRAVTTLAREQKREPIIIIKSTVVPGTTTAFAQEFSWKRIGFNPEFLTEANALADFINPHAIVIGSEDFHTLNSVGALYRMRFPEKEPVLTGSATAEMVKYMANTFLATKVIFANEIKNICDQVGVPYDEVKTIVALDPRIGNSHLSVTSEYGFGGKCFPKDLLALVGFARERNIDISLLETVWQRNVALRSVRDWELIPGAQAAPTEYTDV